MARNNEDIVAFLGKDASFKGVLTYEGAIRIDGKMEGEIVSQGDLIIGASAVIDAKISVGSIVCAGKVSGDLQATKQIHFLKNATMNGSINTSALIIDEGVSFNGQCEMKKAAPTPKVSSA
ncbi:MAG: polymer-forming cytoskeletal protein [Nitrospiria bacterium]